MFQFNLNLNLLQRRRRRSTTRSGSRASPSYSQWSVIILLQYIYRHSIVQYVSYSQWSVIFLLYVVQYIIVQYSMPSYSQWSVINLYFAFLLNLKSIFTRQKRHSYLPPVQVIVVLVTAFNDWSKEKQFRGLQVSCHFHFLVRYHFHFQVDLIFFVG